MEKEGICRARKHLSETHSRYSQRKSATFLTTRRSAALCYNQLITHNVCPTRFCFSINSRYFIMKIL
jgi:hypothetical protein